ncbi:hypothetical protein ACUXAV_003278 [Cupriavidus metallidurans]|jgi:hypothetical protein|uniref:Uncharacterized protein n=2 Tax=Cupriavidus metallidurans TaxID=119219 RepID=Q1LD50_CUPMC|nr:conserved hypothetical protein [Cupriavidus metallidurans CH34]KWW34950.1 hypothetical protein AU374_03824 [Cupriavidus metallidurans]
MDWAYCPARLGPRRPARLQSRPRKQGGDDMNRFYAMVAVCGLMAACVSTGIDVKPEQMQSFILGFSTLDDVTGQLGNPTSQATTSDGAIVLVYAYATSKPHPESFLPFIGPLFAGGDILSSTVLFEFDQNGVLRSERRTTSSGATGLTVLPH